MEALPPDGKSYYSHCCAFSLHLGTARLFSSNVIISFGTSAAGKRFRLKQL